MVVGISYVGQKYNEGAVRQSRFPRTNSRGRGMIPF